MTEADQIIAKLGLQPHPEGGWYRRLHTSGLAMPVDGRSRPAITAIVYLLRAGELSRWQEKQDAAHWAASFFAQPGPGRGPHRTKVRIVSPKHEPGFESLLPLPCSLPKAPATMPAPLEEKTR